MNSTLFTFVLILASFMTKVHSRFECSGLHDRRSCSINECCANNAFHPSLYMCKHRGSSVGDRCGGKFLCGCAWGLDCVPDAAHFWNRFNVGTGTCKRKA